MKKKEEKERNEFYVKVTKQLDDFKMEYKKDEKETKNYQKALMKNVTNLESKQNTVVNEVAKKVVNETRISSYDRSQRERNVMVFNLKEEDDAADEKLIKELFEFINVDMSGVEFFRLGKSVTTGKTRPVKITFKNIDDKKKFFLSLYKLENSPESLKEISIQHDLSQSERDDLKVLVDKAKDLNKIETSEEFKYKVRGPPCAFRIVKVFTKSKN